MVLITLDQEAREWGKGHLRGGVYWKKTCFTGKLCLWQFSSISCLRGSMAPCLGVLDPLAPVGATICLILSPIPPNR